MTQDDPGKRRAEWQKRFKDYEASGLTVTQFCGQADLSPHTFYYWRKRLRQTADKGRRRSLQNVSDEGGAKRSITPDACSAAMVHFSWGSALQISVPAHCMDAIRCVLDCASRAGDDTPRAARTFREVVLAQ